MDVNNKSDRAEFIKEIKADENRQRREEHFKRSEIYGNRNSFYIDRELEKEFSRESVEEMRKIRSVNLCREIVNELGSIYKKPAERMFTDVTDEQYEQLQKFYQDMQIDRQMKRANRLFKLHGQCTIKMVPNPKTGLLIPKPMSPHFYDVIPDDDDPTKAKAYIISVLDRSLFYQDVLHPSRSQNIGDRQDQGIADVDDYASRTEQFVWWTDEAHFTTDRRGNIISEVIANPIGVLPFIDMAEERDFEYWVRAGSDIVDFQIDFLKILSDHFNTMKLQGYSQAVMISEEMPEQFRTGPNQILHLKQRSDGTQSPVFEFVSPSPDVSGSLESIEMFIRVFLSSHGLNAGSIATRDGGESFSSGLERLLAMLEKFEATDDDRDVMVIAEQKMYQMIKKWQDASSNNDLINDRYKIRGIPDSSEVEVNFYKPEMIQTQKEVEDSVIKLIDAGLMSRKQAVARLNDVSEEMAEELLREIDGDLPKTL